MLELSELYQTSFDRVDIDRAMTANRVRKFLRSNFQVYLARAGMHKADLSSPSFESIGSSGSVKNGQEAKLMKIFDYENKCLAVYKAIEGCSHNLNYGIVNRDILECLYIQELTDSMTQDRLNIWGGAYWLKKQDALCEFADRVVVESIKLDTDIPELRVWRP